MAHDFKQDHSFRIESARILNIYIFDKKLLSYSMFHEVMRPLYVALV